MTIFDWDELRQALQIQPTRDAVIRAAFDQWIDGNDCFDHMDRPELQSHYDTFRAACIICEVVNTP